jgi:hypothetical protein
MQHRTGHSMPSVSCCAAVLAPAAEAALRWPVGWLLGDHSPFTTFYLAVVISAPGPAASEQA